MVDYIVKEKLKWRSRRSMLELDLYFDNFIKQGGLDKLSEDEYLGYEKLLTLDDGDLLLLLQGTESLVDKGLQNLVDKIRIYTHGSLLA